ncbi:nucleoside triphosphate pyrophosphohydrolase [Microcoleus sp. FACHB-68]|uniref:nucleoside triphosphate pyrophosphohydrolase n=1 Tax=Microcoleus sp. FACHB-68 TaxID=2692826 RepID=UPI001686BB2B|nr:nucleoside triphosphate pyrophosphohydrolase [Microcoleus sp. FACHB-68]MBD1936606.1 nucleoside triphosphate pyrophosphohydrolase [Microcoleus sp. FACHB-68]
MSTAQTPEPAAFDSATLTALQKLIEVVAKLRSPDGGCPWDLEQTPQTLIPYVIEEAYEVVDAIRSGDKKAIAEELGDLLLQVVLQAQIASESGDFTMAEVATGITEKLIRRHPHVFGDVEVNSVDEVRQNWEEIKATEKGETTESQTFSSKLSRYAKTLPPLMAGMKISEKAAGVGFEWENVEGVWEKFQEELGEFKYALEHEDKAHQQAELGDILFVLINLGRWYDLDPAEALQETNLRFIQRFSKMEVFAERPLTDYSLDELEAMWQKAKAQLAKQKQERDNSDE